MGRHRQKRDSRKYLIQSDQIESDSDSNQRSILFKRYKRLNHDVPWDIIEEILSYLPVKSLLKFKCVAKSWLSLISSPYFIKTHLQKSSKNVSHTHHRVLLRCSLCECCHYSPCHFLKNFSLNSFLYNRVVDSIVIPWDEFHVVDSCNGLFCITSSNGDDVFLWNPSTRKYRKLPDSGEDIKTNFNCYGFGFDESTNDYKIVRVQVDSDSYSRVKVYSLKTDSWKRIENFPACPRYRRDVGLSNFVNGKIYWPINCSTGTKIVSLDIRTKMYENIQLPFPDDIHLKVMLGSLGGCLGMLATCYSNRSLSLSLSLWIMKECGVKKSWTNVVNFPCNIYPYCEVPSPLYMLNDGKILLVFGSMFVLYNPKDQSRKSRDVRHTHYPNYNGANIYVETLVSPTVDDGLEEQTEQQCCAGEGNCCHHGASISDFNFMLEQMLL